MNAGRWSQVEQLYHSAREQEPGERERFLTQACAADEELRREVESLLSYETETAMLLDRPALEVAARALAVDRRSAMIGQTLGHYRVESWLGAGGMGEVYGATDTRLGRAVAVKVLSEHLSTHPDALSRFESEARAAAALSHPNILAIHDFGDEHGIAYAVTELLHGETLRARLNGSPLDARTAVDIAIAIADGLTAAHAKGITHRDLKPENIFLTKDGGVKILDFGLAQIEPLLSGEGTGQPSKPAISEIGMLIGTVAYMSPEQAERGKVDPRSDVFSFGSVLYEMLAGQRAFQGTTKLETLAAIRHEEPRDIARLVAKDLQPIVVRCLRKEPASRFPSAQEVLVELRKVPAGPMPLARRKVIWVGATVLAIGLAGSYAWLPQRWRGWLPFAGQRMTSLAVLPLANLSNDPAEEYFADGMTDVLIADLAQISSLRVISRTSVMQFKGTKNSLPEIARMLNVDGIIEGSVLRSGDQVRITAQLVDTLKNRHVWAKNYERKVGDVLLLQSEVARAIAGEIQAQITPQESGRLARSRAVSPAALEAYLKGLFYWSQYTDESLTKSIEYYEQAAAIDASYAAAYAGLSESWTGLGWIGARPWANVRAMARDAAMKAIAIDDTLSDGHAALTAVSLREWDWKTAEREAKKAVALNPGNSTAHISYSSTLRYLGRREESIAEAGRSVELDPLAVLTNQALANAYVSARRYDLAIAQCLKALELHPDDSSLTYILGWAYVYKGMHDKGTETITKSLAVDGVDPDLSPDLAYIHAVTGKKDQARKSLALLEELAKQSPVDPALFALIYVGLGQRQEALTLLEQAYRGHSSMMTWLKVDARFDGIREEPRFQDLMRGVGLI